MEAVKLSRVFELINTCFSVIKIRQDSHRINLCFYRFDLFSGKVYYRVFCWLSAYLKDRNTINEVKLSDLYKKNSNSRLLTKQLIPFSVQSFVIFAHVCNCKRFDIEGGTAYEWGKGFLLDLYLSCNIAIGRIFISEQYLFVFTER